MNLLGIMRHRDFSPNHVGNDMAILLSVAEILRLLGHDVITCSEEEFLSMPESEIPSLIFHMARRQDVLQKLLTLTHKGYHIVNHPEGVLHCSREEMTIRLLDAGIPHPQSYCLPTVKPFFVHSPELHSLFPIWLKRGDFHAVHREDVTYVRTPEEADGLLEEYRMRGIDRVVVNRHLHGDLVKFYGVFGTSFFYWFYPMEQGHSKFGCESFNDAIRRIHFSVEELKKTCDAAAHVLNISIYGGDCIIDEEGQFRIIDFNDWPSFAPCREEAAPYIARAILSDIS